MHQDFLTLMRIRSLQANGDLAPWGAPDNKINAGDLLIAKQLVLGRRSPGQLQFVHGDMNVDGVIDLTDLLLIQKTLLHYQHLRHQSRINGYRGLSTIYIHPAMNVCDMLELTVQQSRIYCQ